MSGLAVFRRHRETIGLWLLAVVFATACVFLAQWQLHRYQAKHAKAQLVARNYESAAVPLGRLLPSPATGFDRQLQWRQVRVSGRYDEPATRLVRNRPRTGDGADAVYGYEVVVPLRLDDGSALLIDRGWLASGTTGSTPGNAPDSVPVAPRGRVEVVARLKATEPERSRSLPAGQVASVAVRSIATDLRYPVYDVYGVLVSETPSVTPSPAPLDPPVVDGNEGINASYAVQWGLFALLGLGFPVWVARRRRTAEDEAAGPALPRTRPADVPARALEPARVRRRRIWDADDE